MASGARSDDMMFARTPSVMTLQKDLAWYVLTARPLVGDIAEDLWQGTQNIKKHV